MLKIGYSDCGIISQQYDISIIQVDGVLEFTGKVNIGCGVRIVCSKNAIITFGKNVSFTGNTDIICYKNIIFGDNSLVSWNCLFLDTDFHKVYIDNVQINVDEQIIIGENVWICSDVRVLKGSIIPTGSVVACGTLFNRKMMDPNSLYCGIPVTKRRDGVSWRK